MNTGSLKAAVVQMVSGSDPAANIQTMRRLVRQAADQGAQWVLLPEYWPQMGQERDKLALAEPFGSGRFQTALGETAAECGVVLFGGSIPLASGQPEKVFNSLLVFDENGRCLSRYDKAHLFGFDNGRERYAEADTIAAGSGVPRLEIGGRGIGQGICYDLRFPELFRAQAPFNVLMLPAAFTYTTGSAHWQLLLRTRAVENQCYLLAAAQGGRHDNGRRTYGHSMIVDPWGDIVACLSEGEGVLCADLDFEKLQSVRRRLPALAHRRF